MVCNFVLCVVYCVLWLCVVCCGLWFGVCMYVTRFTLTSLLLPLHQTNECAALLAELVADQNVTVRG
jgi:hypothetical protein